MQLKGEEVTHDGRGRTLPIFVLSTDNWAKRSLRDGSNVDGVFQCLVLEIRGTDSCLRMKNLLTL
jgi:hypothetical protein